MGILRFLVADFGVERGGGRDFPIRWFFGGGRKEEEEEWALVFGVIKFWPIFILTDFFASNLLALSGLLALSVFVVTPREALGCKKEKEKEN